MAGLQLSLASVLRVLGGCPGCQKCWWLCSLHLHQGIRNLNKWLGGQPGFLASPSALTLLFFFLWLKASLVTAALYAVCCKKCSWLAGKISAQFLLAVSRRWDGTEEDQWTGEKAHFKINWIDKTPKRMELFAGHDEGFDICVITLTFVNQMCFLPHSERGSF